MCACVLSLARLISLIVGAPLRDPAWDIGRGVCEGPGFCIITSGGASPVNPSIGIDGSTICGGSPDGSGIPSRAIEGRGVCW